MSYVITEKCLEERYAVCVSVCPVNCIHPGDYQSKPFMIIDPTECINCGACLPVCPIGAIIDSEEQDQAYGKINAELAPEFKTHTPVPERPRNDPPKKPTNKLIA